MATKAESPGGNTVFCRDCGAEIRVKAEICPECGIRQEGGSATSSTGGKWTEQYSVVVWIISILFGLLTFPIGLIIPAYFLFKASNGTGAEQGGWEVGTVILLGLLGIIAVELGGEKGAKVLWGIFAAFIALILLIAIAAV